jgi:hypothetical protein
MAGIRQIVRDILLSLSATMPDDEAEARAVQLLARNLTRAQRERYETCRYFDVIGGDTGARYRIRHGYQMNVELLDREGRRSQIWCFVPKHGLPAGDIMLAQKIALELFEPEAIRVAKKSYVDLEYEMTGQQLRQGNLSGWHRR